MQSTFLSERRSWKVTGLAALIVVVLFLISGFFTWSPLHCWHDDVDIRSGRLRQTYYVLYVCISERTEETWLSRVREPANAPPDWRRVNTFSPWVSYSPHYAYHGALMQIAQLEQLDQLIPFQPDARREIADRLLTLWQASDSYYEAGEYVRKVSATAMKLLHEGANVVQASDLPTE